MKIVIAIPTLNRCEKLKRNIDSIYEQVIPDGVELSLAVSNSASTDSTAKFLRELSSHRIDTSIFNQQTGWTGGNYGYLASIIPEDADWVWFMGDDDYLPTEDIIGNVSKFLLQASNNKQFALLHACQARRSTGSGKIIEDKLLNLCNRLGYTEMLGWISSMVVKKNCFVKIMKKIDARVQLARNEPVLSQSHSAFFHSSYFLQDLFDQDAAFIDLPLVEPQDEVMTHETRERWHYENMSERYIYIMDDLERIAASGVPLQNLSKNFFRYHEYSLWDRFMSHQLNVLREYAGGTNDERVHASMQRFVENWGRISATASYLKCPVVKKQLINSIEMSISLCNLLIEKNFDGGVLELLSRQLELLSIRSYDFNLLQKETFG
ncbi:glycosyltransferase [Alphaproteobacteria bacterium]|nr:glycosyltransferase [Alphaproteobacteria bacterium]MDC1120296.1 glycosyltransferase [Alphaproteobacteria bacterium]